MPTIYIDNQPYAFEGADRNLLDVCLSLGFDVPYFCWHPALHSVGACRQCAVKLFKDEHDAKGRLVMSCMTPAADLTRISIDDAEAAGFRARVIEWLMVNHPHDCPVCDEGGECHLQDMTVLTGQVYRRYRFAKRTHRNQDLGPLVNHEMNRCIQCYRCVRFYRDYAGGRDLEVTGWHDGVYFGRSADGTLESEFSGNLVEVCPTGVFTDKSLKRHYTRPWDLQTAPSICVHCGLGCNTIPGERYGRLRRIRARYHGQVNGYFLCDRGRYGYEFVNSRRRLRRVLLRASGGELEALEPEPALARIAAMMAGGRTIGIGSPRASLESNFALRELVGAENFFHGLRRDELELLRLMLRLLREGPARSPSLKEVEAHDAVLVLGEDLTNVAPMLDLALRQSVMQQPYANVKGIARWDDSARRTWVQDQRGPLYIATPDATKLDDQSAATLRAAPDDIARLGFAVAHALDPAAPPVASGTTGTTGVSPVFALGTTGVSPVFDLSGRIAHDLQQARRPLVIAGPSCGSAAVIESAANVAWALCRAGKPAGLCLTAPECNSFGIATMPGGDLDEARQAVRSGQVKTVIVLENSVAGVSPARPNTGGTPVLPWIVVLDHLANATTERADVVLPAATFAETDGTLVSSEGRAQRFFQVFVPDGQVRASWRWLGELSAAVGLTPINPWQRLDDVLSAMGEALPELEEIPTVAPSADFRAVGQRIPRQPHRYSGRTAMTAEVDVHEPQSAQDADAPLAFSMEGFDGLPPSGLNPRCWWPGWNSPQAITKFQLEAGGPLRGGDPGKRLLEPSPGAAPAYAGTVPGAFAPRPWQLLLLPAWHIYGSEELSMLSAGIAQLAPRPYVGLSPADARRLGLTEGQDASVSAGGTALRLPVRIRPALAEGVAVLPVGLASMALPAWGTVGPGQVAEHELHE